MKTIKTYDKDNNVTFTNIIVERGQPDADGNFLDIDKINFPEKVPLTTNFSTETADMIGEATLRKEDGMILADIKLNPGVDLVKGGYPAIGGILGTTDPNFQPRITILSVQAEPNADLGIQMIDDQVDEVHTPSGNIIPRK